jgi:hypothetical protein
MPALDMHNEAIAARQNLAYAMRTRSFPVSEIMAQLGYRDASSVYSAIKAGRERAASNESRVSSRSFGIELEFNGCSRSAVVTEVKRLHRGFPIERQGYNHRVQEVWKMITDASVNGTDTDPDDNDYEASSEGLELVSPILNGADGYRQIEQVLEAIHNVGGEVDNSCGLHVHHDARDLTPDQLAGLLSFYIENQTVIDQLLAPSRRSNRRNQWCQPWEGNEKAEVIRRAKEEGSFQYFDRYRTINVTSYPKYGSIEFRQHQGTLNLRKIMAWVTFGQAVVEATAAHGTEAVKIFTTPADLLEWLNKTGGLAQSTVTYMLDQTAKYAARSGR